VVGVHQAASLQPAGRPRRTEHFIEAKTDALGMGARRSGAAARGAADLRLSCGSTLGCVVYQQAGARLPRTPTRSSVLVTRGVARGVAAASASPAPKQSAPTGSQGKRTATASSRTWKVQALRAAAGALKHTRLSRDPVQIVPVHGHSRACARAASSRPLGAALW
jgi:hypothetical protein